jgi:hypothetical protein
MATYRQIQRRVRRKNGVSIKTCWIAHVKEKCGLHLRRASNRISPTRRAQPCPASKVKVIKKAFRHFGII